VTEHGFLRESTCKRELPEGNSEVKMVTGINRHEEYAAGIRELVNIRQ
jgi:hypothetical protein